MFDLDRFVADCRAALAADRTHNLVHEVVVRAVSNPVGILKGAGRNLGARSSRSLSRAGPNHPQRDLGPDDDHFCPTTTEFGPSLGSIRSGGQHLLAAHQR